MDHVRVRAASRAASKRVQAAHASLRPGFTPASREMRILPWLFVALSFPVFAAGSRPEIVREPGKPQNVGALHTVRSIPEACARLEGMFTGDATRPYRFAAVKSSPTCQPRARFVDFAKAQPSEAKGWKFNDEIHVPSAGCPSQSAVVRVWRKPADAMPPKLDAQGRSRIYLHEANEQAKNGTSPNVPMYAAEMKLEGKACGR
jgi:hypothetical protein